VASVVGLSERARRLAVLAVVLVIGLVGCNPLSNATGGPPPAGSTASAGADSRPPLSPPPIDLTSVPPRVHVATAASTSGWIGPAGGTLTATAPDGTGFELDVPRDAVREATPITMTPIESVDQLGLSGGLAGAVYLGPSGLQLAVPATLRITAAPTVPAGTRLVGFDVGDDGTTSLAPATVDRGAPAVLVFHFSSPGAGFGTSADLQRLASTTPGPTSGRLSSILTQILSYDVPWSTATLLEVNAKVLLIWDNIIEPELCGGTPPDPNSCAKTDRRLTTALADWRQFVFLLNLFAHKGNVSAALADGVTASSSLATLFRALFQNGQNLLGTLIAQALDANRDLCIRSHDLGALANTWYWASVGSMYAQSVTTWANNAAGCANLAIAVANLPTSMTNGEAGTIFLQFVMAFSDGTNVNADVEAALTASGFTFARTGGHTVTDSVPGGTTLQEGVLADAPPSYSLAVHACWSLAGIIRDVCPDLPESWGSGPTAPPVSLPPASGTLQLTVVPVVGVCTEFTAGIINGSTGWPTFQHGWSASGPASLVEDQAQSAFYRAGPGSGIVTINATGFLLDGKTPASGSVSLYVDDFAGRYLDPGRNAVNIQGRIGAAGEIEYRITASLLTIGGWTWTVGPTGDAFHGTDAQGHVLDITVVDGHLTGTVDGRPVDMQRDCTQLNGN